MATGLKLDNNTYWDATSIEIPCGEGHQTLQGLCDYQIQSGTINGTMTVNVVNSYNVTFPVAFPTTAKVKVFLSIQKKAGGYYIGDSAVWAYNITNTGFTCAIASQGIGGNAGACVAHWIAMDVSGDNKINNGTSVKTPDNYPWIYQNIYDSKHKKTASQVIPKIDCGTVSFSAPASTNEAHITVTFNKTFSSPPRVALTYGMDSAPNRYYGSIMLNILSTDLYTDCMTVHYYAYSTGIKAHTGYIHWLAIGE